MVQLLTRGIRVSVEVFFEGTYFKDYKLNYSYAYQITIHNQGKESVQLQSRHWEIIDSLRAKTIIDGEGVVGKKPVIAPGKSYTYSSGCLVTSSLEPCMDITILSILPQPRNLEYISPNLNLTLHLQ